MGLGGIKPELELTRQEFKILNQAVNPQRIGNEEASMDHCWLNS